MRLYFLFLIVGFYFMPCVLFAQDYERKKDSTDKKTKVQIEEIKEKSKSGKLSKLLSRLLINDPNKKGVSRNKTRPTFEHAEGKVIRKIDIVTLDPFGYSLTNPDQKPDKWIKRASNAAHIKSSRLAIRNYLLFRKNKRLDSTKVLESARLLRNQNFIRRVHIEAHEVGLDSVDVKIRVLDAWSTVLIPSVSANSYKGDFREQNFLGLGHSFVNKVSHRTDESRTRYSGRYTIPNIYNTYIRSTIRYSKDFQANHYKRIAFDRPFYSNLATWAGGVEMAEVYFRDSLPNVQQEYEIQPVKYFQQRYWGAYSVPVVDNPKSEFANYRLISSMAYDSKNYSETPTQEFDSIGYYSNERHLLFKVALSSNSYVQDRYVFRYNEVEDIPIGKLYSITTGIRRKRNRYQMYLGLRYSFGNYHRIGYFGGDVQVGSYYDKGRLNQAALNVDFTYFTPIIDVGSWRFRQFATQSLKYGINRDPIVVDNIGLLGEDGIKGFNESVYGNKRAVLTLQTQSYAPGALLGFRFNPFINATLGVVGKKGKSIFNSTLYSRLGLGVLITNDYFVIERFQLSMSYYPHVPSEGSHILHFNSLRNHDFNLDDFNSTRPEVVPYTYPRVNKYP
ncbi:MAG TPA: hypothetical protein VK050_04490 [Flavobacteriaceae bacterium]|nr:hypothetical protein [Flavobacteriaceae bacterium]